MDVRVYRVGDLARANPGYELDWDTVINLITSSVAPPTWDTVGGPGSIDGWGECLILSQTRETHRELTAQCVTIRSHMT